MKQSLWKTLRADQLIYVMQFLHLPALDSGQPVACGYISNRRHRHHRRKTNGSHWQSRIWWKQRHTSLLDGEEDARQNAQSISISFPQPPPPPVRLTQHEWLVLWMTFTALLPIQACNAHRVDLGRRLSRGATADFRRDSCPTTDEYGEGGPTGSSSRILKGNSPSDERCRLPLALPSSS